jgi:cytochrome b
MSASAASTDVKAWDWPTRAFHWTLVFCVFNAWASIQFASRFGDNNLVWHRWNGYTILVLVTFRLLWGLVGSSTARFVNFVRWPWRALSYLGGFFSADSKHYLGHNPVGTWMILALLVALIAQGLMGLFMIDHNEVIAGPLKRLIDHDLALLVGKWHTWFFNVLIGLACVHMTANALYGVLRGEPLIQAMVSGRKPAHAYADQAEAIIPDDVTRRALVCLGAAVMIVFGGITLAGGRIL